MAKAKFSTVGTSSWKEQIEEAMTPSSSKHVNIYFQISHLLERL